LDRDTVERLIVKQRYGLHCTKYEHFGLAAAEMQSLGCIAFVPDYSGQREVVRTAVQRYTDVADAVLKIEMVLQSPAVQRDLLESSRNMKDVLSVSRFTKGIQEAVKCIEQRARDGAFQKAESI
jgi:glycosyltransferase involved in cell wall biosynthesis